MNQNDAKCTQLLVLHCSDEASAGGQTPLIVASQDKKSPQQIYFIALSIKSIKCTSMNRNYKGMIDLLKRFRKTRIVESSEKY